MGKFDGKTLLLLGSSLGSVDIADYARSEGAYVIVTDYLPPERSEAKRHADETAMVSTTDVNALCHLGREKKIDGVFCGVSETNLVSVNAVAERLGLPCYFTREQWEQIQNKEKFHALCQRCGVPMPRLYKLSNPPRPEELVAICYPVVVKPVDGSSGSGVHICQNETELLSAYMDALSVSACGEAIVEEYVAGAQISAHYTVIDGQCRLSSIGDWHMYQENSKTLPQPWMTSYPSRYIDWYLKEADALVKEMAQAIGMKNGTFFVQGIVDGKRIAFIDPGLRLAGSCNYHAINEVNRINILQLLTDYALTGKMTADIRRENPYYKGKRFCLFFPNCREGKIAKISGLEGINDVPGVIHIDACYREGDVVSGAGTLKQTFLWCHILRDTPEQLRDSLCQIQSLLSVLDEDGNSMLLPGVDPDVLLY